MVKIPNEVKIGTMAIAAIGLLIMGFNFLKGRDLFKNGNFLYAKYPNAKGLMVSNGVFINGFKVGSVYDIASSGLDLKEMVVTIKLSSPYHIPTNSIASIKESALSAPSIEITLGNNDKFLTSGDTMLTGKLDGLLGSLTNKFAPIGDKLVATIDHLDSLLNNINSLLSDNNKASIAASLSNLSKATESLGRTATSMEMLMDPKTGSLQQTMNNVNSFTKNLADNNPKINRMMGNIEKTTENFSKADIDGTVASLKSSLDKVNVLLDKMNNKDGTVGLLLNDKQLYNNLTNTVRSTNILIDDLKTNPKRYVNVSVFGKKDKSVPLQAPLNETKAH